MSLAGLAQSLLEGAPHQDWIVLGGHRSPGLAVLRGAGSPRNWDVQQGYALTGAFVTFTGSGLAKFEVDIFAWEPEHFRKWKLFARATLAPPAPVRHPTSLAIEHPQLNDPPLSILQVVVEDVTQWEQGPDGDGLWARTIKLLQYRKPIPITPTRAGIPPAAVEVKPPADPREAQAAAGFAEIEALGKRLAGE